jgi:hypothetical protein
MATDWLDILEKIFLPVAGYFARMLQTTFGRKRMRRQLYREISRNYHKLDLQIYQFTSVAGIAQGAPLRFAEKLDISFDVWNFYNDEKRRASLFELAEADAIARVYEKLSLIGMDLPGYAHVRAKEALAEIEDRLFDKGLDPKLFKNVSSPEKKQFVADLISGKREPYRKSLSPF